MRVELPALLDPGRIGNVLLLPLHLHFAFRAINKSSLEETKTTLGLAVSGRWCLICIEIGLQRMILLLVINDFAEYFLN